MIGMIGRYVIVILLLMAPAANMHAQTSGCTDPLAVNYNNAATQNDGSCTYAAVTINPLTSVTLSDTVKETSGLIYWNGALWTHNDDTYNTLYALDTADGHIIRKVTIANGVNHDWEEVTQDSAFIYIGDFGNNGNGNRTDLAILKISKADILAGDTAVQATKIAFSYADQTNFTPTGNNNTDFDCEAFIAAGDSLYLFNKEWISRQTRVYALPKTPGTYVTAPQAQYNVQGLVTGATYLPAKRAVLLCGYDITGVLLQPFVVLLYDFRGVSFFSGNKRKLTNSQLYHQTEGIATADGRTFFISNEQFDHSPVNVPQALQRFDLSAYLSGYYGTLHVSAPVADEMPLIYPNPCANTLWLHLPAANNVSVTIRLVNMLGETVENNAWRADNNGNIRYEIPALLPDGNYLLHMQANGREWQEKIARAR